MKLYTFAMLKLMHYISLILGKGVPCIQSALISTFNHVLIKKKRALHTPVSF